MENDFRHVKSLLLESRVELMVGKSLRVVSRLLLKVGLAVSHASSKLTSSADIKAYYAGVDRLQELDLARHEKESLRPSEEFIGDAVGVVADVVPDNSDPLPPLETVGDEVARLEFLRTNGELMPEIIKEPEDFPGDLFGGL